MSSVKDVVAVARSRFVRISPYKLRAFVDGIRGKDANSALIWLKTCPAARVVAVLKTLKSAIANAVDKNPDLDAKKALVVSVAKVDQGPTFKYFKPGAMGRGVVQRRRLCHVEIGLSAV
ncbi:50S ribosomal protein L22 [Candidatus Dependentiae bacterium]